MPSGDCISSHLIAAEIILKIGGADNVRLGYRLDLMK